MAKQRRAKRITSRRKPVERDDTQSMSERAAESLTEIAATSGAQALRFAAAVARGMAKGVASAVEVAADAGRTAVAIRRRRRPQSPKRRSA